MSAAWTLAPDVDPLERCGCCGQAIAAGHPMLAIRLAGLRDPRPKLRCVACGGRHLPLTDEALEHAQQARVDVLERAAIHVEPDPIEPVRFARPRLVKSFASMRETAATVFDFKAKQSGDDR